MASPKERAWIARLVGITVFDPLGDPVGRVRDVVMMLHAGREAPTAVGLVVEVAGRRRIFLPFTRVTSVSAGQVICNGLLNLRRFQKRPLESLAIAELLERSVDIIATGETTYIEDILIEPGRRGIWTVTQLYVRKQERRKNVLGFTRRGEGKVVDIDDVTGLATADERQGAVLVIESFANHRPADLAAAMREMDPGRAAEIAAALDDERLADVLEELPEEDQITLLGTLKRDRAADVLEAMDPDDAADLLGDLPEPEAQRLLELMEPDDADSVRQLLDYEDDTAGGLMTTDAIVVGPETTVATCLALVRREEVTPAMSSMVMVSRPPLETPTGKFIGAVHTQRLLREPPSATIGNLVDAAVEPLSPTDSQSEVARRMAAYDFLTLPVVDPDGRLIGVITIDDVLDQLLPNDWREQTQEIDLREVADG